MGTLVMLVQLTVQGMVPLSRDKGHREGGTGRESFQHQHIHAIFNLWEARKKQLQTQSAKETMAKTTVFHLIIDKLQKCSQKKGLSILGGVKNKKVVCLEVQLLNNGSSPLWRIYTVWARSAR